MPAAERIDSARTWRARAGIVLAAGSRPCAGAVLVLVSSRWRRACRSPASSPSSPWRRAPRSHHRGPAALAVFAKRAALALAGGRGQAGAMAVGGLELLAAAFVLVLGVAMLAGVATGVGG